MLPALQVWYGVLFSLQPDAERPALPAWAQNMLDDGADDDDMAKALAERGYNGAPLSWMMWLTSSTQSYYGLAVTASVQTAQYAAEIMTYWPDDAAQRYLDSIARACAAIGVDGSANIAWWQTARFLT